MIESDDDWESSVAVALVVAVEEAGAGSDSRRDDELSATFCIITSSLVTPFPTALATDSLIASELSELSLSYES